MSTVCHREAALDGADEAIRTLAPHFLRLPAAYASWMMTIARNHLERCKEVDQKPDADLLGPIMEVLQRMQAGSEREAPEPDGN